MRDKTLDEAVDNFERQVSWQLIKRLLESDMTLADLAKKMRLSKDRMENKLLNPGNLELSTIARITFYLNAYIDITIVDPEDLSARSKRVRQLNEFRWPSWLSRAPTKTCTAITRVPSFRNNNCVAV